MVSSFWYNLYDKTCPKLLSLCLSSFFLIKVLFHDIEIIAKPRTGWTKNFWFPRPLGSRRCLASIVHDEVFMFGIDNREVKVKGSRCGENRGWMWLGGSDWSELRRFPLGRLQVSKNEGAKSRWNKDSEVRRWHGSITTYADLVPDS